MESLNIFKSDKHNVGFTLHQFFNKKNGAGFTLIEISVVMGLLAAIGAFVPFASFDVWRGYNFRGEGNLLISLLQKARNQSINNICLGSGCTDGKPHGVVIRPSDKPDKCVIFQGTSYEDPTRDRSFDEFFDVSDKVNNQESTISEVVFDQLSGNAHFPGHEDLIEGGKIILNEINGTRSETIFINSEGRIDY